MLETTRLYTEIVCDYVDVALEISSIAVNWYRKGEDLTGEERDDAKK